MLLGLIPCYTYMVRCSDGSYYTGMTNNLKLRVGQHNGKFLGGAKYTMRHRPVELVYFEKFPSRKLAHKRELEIKEMSHEQKAGLINKANIAEGKVINENPS